MDGINCAFLHGPEKLTCGHQLIGKIKLNLHFLAGNTVEAVDGGFDDVSLSAQVNMARWAWGAKFADINNDGWEDLYVANGYITADDTEDL